MENIPSRIDSVFPQILEQFITELEDRYTTPGVYEDISADDIEMLRKGERVPKTKGKYELLTRIAQDLRLTFEETDQLRGRIFEM